MPNPDTGEPNGDDVAVLTQGRLAAGDSRTTMLLSGALAAARSYCGWHVIGERTVTLTLDGPGSPLLVLPTLRLTDISALTEDGQTIDPLTLEWSQLGLVYKAARARWTRRYRGITATITHGFADAPDFNNAIVSLVDRLSLGQGGPEVIGPFQFPGAPSVQSGAMFTGIEKALLDQYRLEPQP